MLKRKIPLFLTALCITMLIAVFSTCVCFSYDASAAVNADIIVAKDGSGKFKTVQAAIDSIPSNNSKEIVIFIKNGTYKEVVTIKKNKIHLIGESNTGTIITYDNYAGKTKSDGTTYGTSGSGSFYIQAKNITVDNLKIENSFDENINTTGKQAVAAYISGDRTIIRNCIMTGNQDTLYSNGGRQYYYKCQIIGDTDFIFGGATSVFDSCDIISTVRGGYVTAASTDIANYGYLFINCKLTSNAKAQSTYLGRPWRPNAYVVYKTCYLGTHINPNGWTTMSGNAPENARLFEYKSTGPGAVVNSSRRQLSDTEAAKFTTENLLKGTDNWNPVSGDDPISQPLNGKYIKDLKINDSQNSADWSIQSNLQVGDTTYGDRTFKFAAIPEKLLGSEWIRTACDSKTYPSDMATFTAKSDISVYVGLYSGMSVIPAWLGNWKKTGESISTDNSAKYDLYRKDFKAGEAVTLGDNGGTAAYVNYTVVIKPYTPPTFMYGDVNGDNTVNALDLAVMKSYLLGKIAEFPVESGLKAADVNGDSKVNALDFAVLKQYLLGKISSFPAH